MKKLLLSSLVTVLTCSAFALSADLEAAGYEALASDDINLALIAALDGATLDCTEAARGKTKKLSESESYLVNLIVSSKLDKSKSISVAVKNEASQTVVVAHDKYEKGQEFRAKFILSADESKITRLETEEYKLVKSVENKGTITAPKISHIEKKENLVKTGCNVSKK